MKVLLIDDDQNTTKDISFYLQLRYPDAIIISMRKGTKAAQMVGDELPDLVIVDSSLPDIDHLSLVSRIREFSPVPLLVLSEAETDADRARDLEVGADDYVLKPLNPIELLARIGALMRRAQGLGFKAEHIASISNEVSINFTTREVFLSGKRVDLTPTEYELLSELARNMGRVVTHQVILERVWGIESNCDHNSIKKYIYRLRSKLEPNVGKRIFVSERGIGYRLIRPRNF
jgi:two-component system KDP operon response regulator KdpE